MLVLIKITITRCPRGGPARFLRISRRSNPYVSGGPGTPRNRSVRVAAVLRAGPGSIFEQPRSGPL
ncbi:MAG: hypothetical protein IRY99_26160 [Isosphaeraceae bacterium]|nr:hypothetical protein [Isosphaeraceae bacterium]